MTRTSSACLARACACGRSLSLKSSVRWAARELISSTSRRCLRASLMLPGTPSLEMSEARRRTDSWRSRARWPRARNRCCSRLRNRRSSACSKATLSSASSSSRSSGTTSWPAVSMVFIVIPLARSRGESFKDLVELFLQRDRRERLDHVTIHAALGGGDDLVAIVLGRDHQHRHRLERGVCADGAKQVDARHVGHVPVGYHQVEGLGAQHRERRVAVFSLLDEGVRKSQLDQEVPDDASHGGEIVHHEDFHVLVQNSSPPDCAFLTGDGTVMPSMLFFPTCH